MLTAFSLENYRSFADKTTIELRPLTLLFGYNNAGKSALVRALPLLADSVRPEARGPLDLSSEAVRDCGFDDLKSRLSDAEVIQIGLSFGDEVEVPPLAHVDFHIRKLATVPRLVVSELHQRDEGGISVFSARWLPDEHLRGGLWTHELHMADASPVNMDLEFRGLVPGLQSLDNRSGLSMELELYLHTIRQHLRLIGRDVQWLGSLRRYPPRYGRYQWAPPRRMAPDGAGAAEILAYDKLEGGKLLAEVSAWYEEAFQRRLTVNQLDDERFSLDLSPLDKDMPINLADTGEGMAQVLPVLVAAGMAGSTLPEGPRILALEQPELHLHPAAHAPLARYLCRLAAGESPPRMLIETHSENFLLGVQTQIVRGKLSPDRVLVYWVYPLENGRSRVTRITFDQDGRPQGGWPPGVFSEDMDLMRELIRLRRERPAA